MSGILATWNSLHPEFWQMMMADLSLLGQDGAGDWHDPRVGVSLGRTQLFNTPESCLERPVIEAEGCVLVWDGRLDDRTSLLAGKDPVTDAQLLIESYRRWGIDCLDYWVGEFALILWDRHQHRLLVGCDKTGQRSLSYHWNQETLLVCSRALTLFRHPQVGKDLDQVYLAHTLADLGAHPPGSTPFAGIKRLLPGYALILERGQLQHRLVGKLNLCHSPGASHAPEVYYEKFWHVLGQAVSDRLRSYRPVCTTLSGGLDSTTIAAALLKQRSGLDAFSIVTDRHPEFDEKEPIQALLADYPQVVWHPVNCDGAWSLTESWQQLPLPDDPLINCTLPMHLRLMSQIRQQGFGLVFDGEWGDELFRCSLIDLGKTRNWLSLWQRLRYDSRWYATLAREILPYLPPPVQTLWFARYLRRYAPLPAWLSPSYCQTQAMQVALQQYLQISLTCNQADVVRAVLNQGFHAAIRSLYQLIRAYYGLEFCSPLQDQRVIEFALTLPTQLQSDPLQEKIFLRVANQNVLPEVVRTRPKQNYFDPLNYAGIGQGSAAIAAVQQLKSCSFLEGKVDFSQVEQYLAVYRHRYEREYIPGQPFLQDISNKLYSTLAFSRWYAQLISLT